MTRPRSTTSQADELGAIIASLKSRVQAVELLAHTPCSGGGGGGCPCPENVLKAGDTMTGFLTLNADPINALHAATKQYVDSAVSGGPFLPIAGGTMAGALTLFADPTASLMAATKQYVDTGDGLRVLKAGDTMTGFLTLSADPTASLHAATKQYVDNSLSSLPYVFRAGDTMTGFLTLVGDPTSALHAATKQYVDNALSSGPYVLKAGDTMTGTLTMQASIALTANSTRISQVNTSTWSGDAGTGLGKVEYHSNRWYINAGSDSTEVARFRRGASDVGNIANDGRLNFPYWTTTGRNYCNEWIQFDNHTGIYSPLNSAHFYPNNASYGSWRCVGQRNGWSGIEFDVNGGGQRTLMFNGGTSGVHYNGVGWRWRFAEDELYCGNMYPTANNTYWVGSIPAFGGNAHNLHGSYQFYNPSDGRFKDNQKPLPLGLSFIKRLRPVEYTNIYPMWKDADVTDPNNHEKVLDWEIGSRLRSGLIAQEVKQALEDEGVGDYAMWALADKDDPDSFQALSYHEFIAPLIKAVQELDERLQTLENT